MRGRRCLLVGSPQIKPTQPKNNKEDEGDYKNLVFHTIRRAAAKVTMRVVTQTKSAINLILSTLSSTSRRDFPATTKPSPLPLNGTITTALLTSGRGCQVTRCCPFSFACPKTPTGKVGGFPSSVAEDAR